MGSLPPFILVCLCGVFCLAPLTLYLLWLAFVTRRSRPTIISGPWDFAGLVAGLSGFFLFGGAVVLSILQSSFRYWMRGNFEAFRGAWGQEKVTWAVFAGVYALTVIGAVGLTLLARRRSLVVYNVDPDAFEIAVTEVFEQLNRSVERRGNLWISGKPLFELDTFVGGQTVTLRWVGDDRLLFQDVARLLREAVRGLAPEENTATRWLMAAAAGVGFAVLCCFGLLLYFVSLR